MSQGTWPFHPFRFLYNLYKLNNTLTKTCPASPRKRGARGELISLLCRIYVARLYISDLTFASLHLSNVHAFHKLFGYGWKIHTPRIRERNWRALSQAKYINQIMAPTRRPSRTSTLPNMSTRGSAWVRSPQIPPGPRSWRQS